MSRLSELIVEVRDKDLNRLGQIPPVDLNLLIEDQFNNVGSWTITIRSDHEMASALRTPGSGIVVTDRDGGIVCSGPTTIVEHKATIQDPIGTLRVDGITDTHLLADRLCYPDPSNGDPTTQTLSHDVRTGTQETLMHEYVTWNLGPLAVGDRRDTRVTMGANEDRGTTVTKRARFIKLGDLLVELGLVAGLGFRVVQNGSSLEFQTYAVRDRRNRVRLDIRNNQLAGHTSKIAPPTVTVAVVAGQGDLVERQFVERTSAESLAAGELWGRRIEQFIDQRNTGDVAELQKSGDEALAEGGFAQSSVEVIPMEDMPGTEYGTDWQIGDTVTAVVDGVEVPVLCSGFVLKKDSQGFRMGAILGVSKTAGKQFASQVQKLETRVSNLERESGSGGSSVTMIWNGSDYVIAAGARQYVGPADPALYGDVADGSTWDQVDV